MGAEVCLILHRKSANEPAIKEAVKYVRGKGLDLDVRIPWNKKALGGGAYTIMGLIKAFGLEPYKGRLLLSSLKGDSILAPPGSRPSLIPPLKLK